MSAERDAFGPKLRKERERRGITLASVAAATKVALPLLEALERNDLSRWPQGIIYRRAFVRAYVVALGLPPEPVVAEFARLFPGDATATSDARDGAIRSAVPQRPMSLPAPLALTFADGNVPSVPPVYRRLLLSLLELSAIVGVGAFGSWMLGASLLTSAGVVALVYYPLRNATTRATLAVRRDRRRGRIGSRPLRSNRARTGDQSENDLREPLHVDQIAGAIRHQTTRPVHPPAEWAVLDRLGQLSLTLLEKPLRAAKRASGGPAGVNSHVAVAEDLDLATTEGIGNLARGVNGGAHPMRGESE